MQYEDDNNIADDIDAVLSPDEREAFAGMSEAEIDDYLAAFASYQAMQDYLARDDIPAFVRTLISLLDWADLERVSTPPDPS